MLFWLGAGADGAGAVVLAVVVVVVVLGVVVVEGLVDLFPPQPAVIAPSAKLTTVDDGVGISPAALSQSLEDGHIGIASIRTKVLAFGGSFDVRTNLLGTQVTIAVPLRQSAPGSESGPNGVMSAITAD